MTSPDFKTLEWRLARDRDRTLERLLTELPSDRTGLLWELVPRYPQRSGKGLRAALCLSVCRALGGTVELAVNTAAAIELFHNAFLVYDDAQDESKFRRGLPTLQFEYGAGVAINVGNALNLLALGRMLDNHVLLGPQIALELIRDAQEMFHRTLEGQALEIAWIRGNICDLDCDDYYRLCLKKTAWYTTIYPCRAGAWIATSDRHTSRRLDHYAWYLALAFQIQDDLLNLTGEFDAYGKEIAGDLLEAKRTLMLIHALKSARGRDRTRLKRFLKSPRSKRTLREAKWVLALLTSVGSIDFARRASRQCAGAALIEGLSALGDVDDSADKGFLLELPLYVISRTR